MESTNPKKLRAELKDYLEMASKEPIRIQRRLGESYILIDENKYAEMQTEITNLQRRLLSMSNIIDGEVSAYEGPEARLKRFQKQSDE